MLEQKQIIADISNNEREEEPTSVKSGFLMQARNLLNRITQGKNISISPE